MCVKCIFLQLFSEKISGAEGTKLDEEFQEMERVRKINMLLCFFNIKLLQNQKYFMSQMIELYCRFTWGRKLYNVLRNRKIKA